MKAYYDREPIELTDEFVRALERLIEAQLEMMQKAEPELADCWAWGVCYVKDLAHQQGLSFQFGGEDDRPDWMEGRAQVLTEEHISV